VITFVVIALFIWYRFNNPIYAEINLPKEWWWDMPRIKDEGYKLSKNAGELAYWSKEVNLKQQSKEQEFFNELKDNLDFGVIKVSKCWAIVSHVLASNMSVAWKIQKSRFKDMPDKFISTSWKDTDPDNRRQRIMDSYNITCKNWLWNESIDVRDGYVLPVCHGTEESIAWKIASVGFANLSTTDAGFYGKGIYFSSSASYTVPYFSNTRKPAILICFTIPGNPFPVNENPKDEKNLTGKALAVGYQSHYVVTTAAGFPLKLQDWNSQLKRYDELVIAQEAQVVPLFLVRVDTSNMSALITIYNQSTLALVKDEPPAKIETEDEPLLGKKSESSSSSSSSSSAEEDDTNIQMKGRRAKKEKSVNERHANERHANERKAEKPEKVDEVISLQNLLKREVGEEE